jgi:hypothetical protein
VSGRQQPSAAALWKEEVKEEVAKNSPPAAQLRLPRIRASGARLRSAHRRLPARRSGTRSLRSGRPPRNDPLHLHNVLLRRRARLHLALRRNGGPRRQSVQHPHSGSPRLSARPPRHPLRPGRQPVPHRVRPSGHPPISRDARSGASAKSVANARSAASRRRGRSGKCLLPDPLHRLSRYSLRLHHRPLAASNPHRRRRLRGRSPLHHPCRLPLSPPRSARRRQRPHRPRHQLRLPLLPRLRPYRRLLPRRPSRRHSCRRPCRPLPSGRVRRNRRLPYRTDLRRASRPAAAYAWTSCVHSGGSASRKADGA